MKVSIFLVSCCASICLWFKCLNQGKYLYPHSVKTIFLWQNLFSYSYFFHLDNVLTKYMQINMYVI